MCALRAWPRNRKVRSNIVQDTGSINEEDNRDCQASSLDRQGVFGLHA